MPGHEDIGCSGTNDRHEAARVPAAAIRAEQEKTEDLLGWLVDEKTVVFKKRQKAQILRAVREAAAALDYAVIAEDERSMILSLRSTSSMRGFTSFNLPAASTYFMGSI